MARLCVNAMLRQEDPPKSALPRNALLIALVAQSKRSRQHR